MAGLHDDNCRQKRAIENNPHVAGMVKLPAGTLCDKEEGLHVVASLRGLARDEVKCSLCVQPRISCLAVRCSPLLGKFVRLGCSRVGWSCTSEGPLLEQGFGTAVWGSWCSSPFDLVGLIVELRATGQLPDARGKHQPQPQPSTTV